MKKTSVLFIAVLLVAIGISVISAQAETGENEKPRPNGSAQIAIDFCKHIGCTDEQLAKAKTFKIPAPNNQGQNGEQGGPVRGEGQGDPRRDICLLQKALVEKGVITAIVDCSEKLKQQKNTKQPKPKRTEASTSEDTNY